MSNKKSNKKSSEYSCVLVQALILFRFTTIRKRDLGRKRPREFSRFLSDLYTTRNNNQTGGRRYWWAMVGYGVLFQVYIL